MVAAIQERENSDGRRGRPPIEDEALAAVAALRPEAADELVGKIISLYLDSSLSLVREVRRAAEVNNADALYRAAHTLKSSSASLGAVILSEMARDLEMIGRGKTQGDAISLLAALEWEYERVRAALEARLKRG
ncbi:MAG: Hpt domain-containing protein [Deltaproteobacteria bacterium]|nr:Hpt domain-containing protein [Deltaproteobacteria bacterium]